eukprot:366225-Chlamydomonas_euryale.AAC.18
MPRARLQGCRNAANVSCLCCCCFAAAAVAHAMCVPACRGHLLPRCRWDRRILPVHQGQHREWAAARPRRLTWCHGGSVIPCSAGR